jgi:hypothetical protein
MHFDFGLGLGEILAVLVVGAGISWVVRTLASIRRNQQRILDRIEALEEGSRAPFYGDQ